MTIGTEALGRSCPECGAEPRRPCGYRVGSPGALAGSRWEWRAYNGYHHKRYEAVTERGVASTDEPRTGTGRQLGLFAGTVRKVRTVPDPEPEPTAAPGSNLDLFAA